MKLCHFFPTLSIYILIVIDLLSHIHNCFFLLTVHLTFIYSDCAIPVFSSCLFSEVQYCNPFRCTFILSIIVFNKFDLFTIMKSRNLLLTKKHLLCI